MKYYIGLPMAVMHGPGPSSESLSGGEQGQERAWYKAMLRLLATNMDNWKIANKVGGCWKSLLCKEVSLLSLESLPSLGDPSHFN